MRKKIIKWVFLKFFKKEAEEFLNKKIHIFQMSATITSQRLDTVAPDEMPMFLSYYRNRVEQKLAHELTKQGMITWKDIDCEYGKELRATLLVVNGKK